MSVTGACALTFVGASKGGLFAAQRALSGSPVVRKDFVAMLQGSSETFDQGQCALAMQCLQKIWPYSSSDRIFILAKSELLAGRP